jgi:outer membrane protein assembly factor BamB
MRVPLRSLALCLLLTATWAAEEEASPTAVATVHAAPSPQAEGAVGEDWPCFLGPLHNGVSRETRLLHQWPAGGPKLVWSMPRGTGYASPSLVGGVLVYQHRVGDSDLVECLAADNGARRWQMRFPSGYHDRYGYNDGPRATPLIDGDHVYIYSPQGVLRCLAMADGALRWERDLNTEYKVKQNFFGVGTTPLLEGDLLIINLGAPGGPGVVGLDRLTGRTVWGSDDQWGPSYASPVPAVLRGKRRVLVFAGGESRPATGGLLCLDPLTGKIDFRFPWRSKSYESVNGACPVAVGDQVFVTASYQTGGVLLDVAADLSAAPAWTSESFGSHFSTPLHRDGYLYGFHGRNEPDVEMTCIELKTGKVMWSQRPEWEEQISEAGRQRTVAMSPFRGQFLAVDGQVLCLGEYGHLLWYDLTPQGFKEVARTWLFQSPESWTPPVVCHGLLYVCQNHRGIDGSQPRLLCYDLRGK